MPLAKPLLLEGWELRQQDLGTAKDLFFGPPDNQHIWLLQATLTHEGIYKLTNLQGLQGLR